MADFDRHLRPSVQPVMPLHRSSLPPRSREKCMEHQILSFGKRSGAGNQLFFNVGTKSTGGKTNRKTRANRAAFNNPFTSKPPYSLPQSDKMKSEAEPGLKAPPLGRHCLSPHVCSKGPARNVQPIPTVWIQATPGELLDSGSARKTPRRHETNASYSVQDVHLLCRIRRITVRSHRLNRLFGALLVAV